jgi:hypothetical protein
MWQIRPVKKTPASIGAAFAALPRAVYDSWRLASSGILKPRALCDRDREIGATGIEVLVGTGYHLALQKDWTDTPNLLSYFGGRKSQCSKKVCTRIQTTDH